MSGVGKHNQSLQTLIILFIILNTINISIIGIHDSFDETTTEENSKLNIEDHSNNARLISRLRLDDFNKNGNHGINQSYAYMNRDSSKIDEKNGEISSISLNSINVPMPPIEVNSVDISNSGDVEIPSGISNIDIQWIVSGASPQNQRNNRIIRNETELSNCNTGGCWGTVSLISEIGFDELHTRPSGTWVYTLEAWGDNETLDTRVNSTVIVTVVEDVTSPIFTVTPGNVTIEKGTVGNTVFWKATDQFPKNFIIFQNGSQISSGPSWGNMSNISFTGVDNLSLGLTNITLLVFDRLNQNSSHTIFILMQDTITPSFISMPGNTIIQEGTFGNILTWTAGDRNPTKYNITVDGGFMAGNTTWDNSTIFFAVLDGFDEGIYEITLLIYDAAGNVNSNTVSVTVIGPTPRLNSPTDVSFIEGSVGKNITWVAEDQNPFNYEISSNSFNPLLESSGLWNNGIPIVLDLTGLNSGVYVVRITVFDIVGNSAYDEISITVIDISNPVLVLQNKDITYVHGSSNNILQWQLQDDNPGTYSIYVEGEIIIENVAWTNNEVVRFSFEDLEPGKYNITIVVSDLFQNQMIETVIIEIKEAPSPFYRNPDFTALIFFLIIIGSFLSRYAWNLYLKRRVENENEQNALKEINGLLSIQSFVIILPSGIPIFQETFENRGVDLTLLGGLTAAISTFLNHIFSNSAIGNQEEFDPHKVTRNFEVIEKKGLAVISHQTTQSTILIIAKSKLPDIILDKIFLLHNNLNLKLSNYFLKSSEILPKATMQEFFKEVSLKIKLINQLTINVEELYNIENYEGIQDHIVNGLLYLKEFNTTDPVTEKFRLDEIVKFYADKGFLPSKIADLIISAYHMKIIE